MHFRHKINTLVAKLRRVPKKYYVIIGIIFAASLYLVAFRKQTVVYSYGGETCSRRLVVLPGIFKQAGSEDYEITAKGGWSVAGQQLTATLVCVTPTSAPDENSADTVAYAPWGGWLMRLSFTVQAGAHPAVDASALKKPIPASRELLLPLSQPDTTFSYVFEVDDKEAACTLKEAQLACDVPALGLKQGNTYEATLEKYFHDQPVADVAATDIETLSPLSVIDSSVKNDATVYDKPAAIMLTTDKEVKNADIAVWRTDGDKPLRLEATTTLKGSEVTVTFDEELPREATIALKAIAADFEAVDGSTPLAEQLLVFKTSGGPRVTGVNVGPSGVQRGTQIVVTFDQELSPDQDLGPLIAMGGGVALQARSGNQLVFSTSGAAPCASISISLKNDIQSPYGTSGASAWQYSGRMSCYVMTTIGYSSQGRPINAYHFGSSGPAVLYTGAIHGNEYSTKYLMDRWIQDLDANPNKISNGKRVIVVPVINPDGFAQGSRLNARGIDLNRNFSVSDWKGDIEDTRGNPFPGGGGTEAMSEPETRAIAGFVAQQRPELVVSYHSIGGMAISNQRGQANARASQYASLSGYRLSAGDSGEFGYQITGTADDYYSEKLGVASILIELGSHSYHQFERNQAAMWAVMR